MTVVEVINCSGEKTSEIELKDEIFKTPVKASVMHEVVTMQLAGARAGSASVKHRSDIVGSRRKLYRQKGTGRARRGDIKSPLLRGGGSVFGPDPRSYSYVVPKKKKRLALRMALSSKLSENALTVLDKIDLERIKTGDFVKILTDLDKGAVLIVIGEKDEKLELSARNIPNVKILRTEGMNVLDILKHDELILLEPSIEKIERRLCA